MVRKKVKAIGEWIEDGLRRMCGEITPDKRIIVILTMFLLFTGLSLYFTISSIYRFGRGEGERLQIRHIENLELELRQKQSELDSIKHFNMYNYEYQRESESEHRGE
jgi:hypothetical protein